MRSLPIAVLAFLAIPAATTAQQRTAPDHLDFPRPAAPAALVGDAVAPPPLPGADLRGEAEATRPPAARAGAEEARAAGRSFLTTALHLVGGAVVGGWVGYVSSQVALSDWDKSSNGAFRDQRSAWVAGGVVVGILGSRLIGGTTAPDRPGIEIQRPRGGRDVITREQITTSGARNVFELVSSMRKEWLVTRGTNSFRETATGAGGGTGLNAALQVEPGKATVVVYMDDVSLGDAESMRDILINDIMEIRFLDARQATYRYGSGHSHGVILLKTTL